MSDRVLQQSHDPHLRDGSTAVRPRQRRRPLIVLIAPTGSYRTADFVAAAESLRVDIMVATDAQMPIGAFGATRSVLIDCVRPEWSAAKIAQLRTRPDAVMAIDDSGVIIAALASRLLGHSTNPLSAVAATRDKAQMRGFLAAGEVPQPDFRLAAEGQVAAKAVEIGFPAVIKPRSLSASRGVIRVDNEGDAATAEQRIRGILASSTAGPRAALMVEAFIPGFEVAVEAMLTSGVLTVLALIDKPDPLDGPFFEETLFVTPSRLPQSVQSDIVGLVENAVAALGLVSGSIHAEVRIGSAGPVVIEVAARSIGGLCGRALAFGVLGETLESVTIRGALGLPGAGIGSAASASGAMIIPIPRAGELTAIDGAREALTVGGIVGFEQTIPIGRRLIPLPEGDRYLGFLLAEAASPAAVEAALRSAHSKLRISVGD